MRRLANRTDSEHRQAILRIVIVLIVSVYFLTDYFSSNVGDLVHLRLTRLVIELSLAISVSIFVLILLWPAKSVARRLAGMVHDVTAISVSLYLGGGVGAVVAAIYLWITLGNGFRYGIRYLYFCAALSVTGFLITYVSSDYWQSHGTLSMNILLTMIVVPPYVGSLLKSLHVARDRLQRRASYDGLTGLLSRDEIEGAAASLFVGDRSGHVLLFCDLDHFKSVNDVAGHAAGDKLLADVAQIVRDAVRRNDLSGRLGGDEICVLLRNCSLARGKKIAEKIRKGIAGYRLAWGTQYYSVSVSIGVAPASAVNDSESLFRLADAACYAAKNAGRNQVHAVDPSVDGVDTQKMRQLAHGRSVVRSRTKV